MAERVRHRGWHRIATRVSRRRDPAIRWFAVPAVVIEILPFVDDVAVSVVPKLVEVYPARVGQRIGLRQDPVVRRCVYPLLVVEIRRLPVHNGLALAPDVLRSRNNVN